VPVPEKPADAKPPNAMSTKEHFLKPTAFETFMNKAVGLLARWGVGPRYIHLLETRGRKTGKLYATPVNLLEWKGRWFLVGGRGHTAWSKNAGSAGSVILRRGRKAAGYRVISLPDDQKPDVLKAYLQAYRGTVQRFFSVNADAPVEAFRRVVDQHPVFELKRMESE
jgi:deazaflavin-dependent oxidoreductase (nitroreductase family)